MMTKLELMCAEKVKAMRMAYLNPEAEKCKFRCSGYDEECQFYQSIQQSQIPFRRGQYAFEIMRRL